MISARKLLALDKLLLYLEKCLIVYEKYVSQREWWLCKRYNWQILCNFDVYVFLLPERILEVTA